MEADGGKLLAPSRRSPRPQNELTAVLPNHYQSLIFTVKAPLIIPDKKRPRARGSFGAGQAPARNGLGEKALRGRENNSAILHCAEQPARFFLLAEYDTRVA
jgi:hypothetical protein